MDRDSTVGCLVAGGMTVDEILKEHSTLEGEDAALRRGAIVTPWVRPLA